MFEGTTCETQAFISRLIAAIDVNTIESRLGCKLTLNADSKAITINLVGDEINVAITIPAVYEKCGVQLIEGESGVVRAINNYYVVQEERELSYYDALIRVIIGNPTGIVPTRYVKATPYSNCLARSMDRDALLFTFMSLNRAISYVVTTMPLHTAMMESWVKNQRLIFIDPAYDEITDPNEELAYHVEKNRQHFNKGWTSIGLSDSSLSGKNVMLKEDLRRFVPFGLNFHNPQRNLHSTLGMLGDEEPILKTESLQKMSDQGACWTGWNLFTMFVDIPDVWEDQIMVNSAHRDKYVAYTKKLVCPGRVVAAVNDSLTSGDIIAVHDTKATKFDIECDSAYITDISERTESVGGAVATVNIITVDYKRFLKDGTKITNMSANKGIIRMADLGYATDPRTGEKRRIDVIVSAKAVLKRRNYGQLLEAIFNSLNQRQAAVIRDDASTTESLIKEVMTREGFSDGCVWDCNTYVGKLRGICGTVFWGVTHDADDTTWNEREVQTTNSLNLRKKGLKFSPIEFKALETRFGRDNSIVREILSYAQGSLFVTENVRLLESALGKHYTHIPVLKLEDVSNVEYSTGNMLTKESIPGTIADKDYYRDGFYVQLPFNYKISVDEYENVLFEGPQLQETHIEGEAKHFTTNLLYVPAGDIRVGWEHPSVGLYGVSRIVARLKAMISAAKRFLLDKSDVTAYSILVNAIASYINGAASSLGSKRGYVRLYGMSVRYPYSSKGTAALSNDLPKNTVEIHRSMADALRVNDGDIVLVERFPCLGFMSLRPQQVVVSDDEACRYTIRVSKNCLGSLSLDFDGDQLYLAAFHTSDAKRLLKREWTNPNRTCYNAIQQLNTKMGTPTTRQMVLADYNMARFEQLTADSHAHIVGSLTGVKAHTGPVVALAYNVMRIMENSGFKNTTKLNVGVELFLDKVANSVFKQKHGGMSLHTIVTEAICKADVKALVNEGFDEGTSNKVCEVIREKASILGVTDLPAYHKKVQEKGGSNIINRIVRNQNKIYFACRSQQNPVKLLTCLNSAAVDVPSKLFKLMIDNSRTIPYTKLDSEKDSRLIKWLRNVPYQESCQALFKYIDSTFGGLDHGDTAGEGHRAHCEQC